MTGAAAWAPALLLLAGAAGAALPGSTAAAAGGAAVVRIPAGDFAPLFGLDKGQESFPVASFWLDRRPVTRALYAAFTAAHPEWRHDAVNGLYADAQYLKNWDGDRPHAGQEDYPVTYVSWFAATAYCRAQGGRLPSTLEWEYVAAASRTQPDATGDRAFVAGILDWYARPSRGDLGLAPVGGDPNFFGIENLHGSVWEWTSDFNSSFITADNRADGDRSRDFFCGNGVTGAARRDDYAAFIRYAMRSSLGATFTLGNVGFRCAYDRAPAAYERGTS
ncbi:MAG: formylglycine-generating enzyme family protein [Myxococcales bacterium]|nr:formylglycine-generating enzyme family protein [Myxococcales bacterium]